LYKAETASITGNDGTVTSNAVSITVSPAAYASLVLSAASGSITAGGTDQLTITAKDSWGNVAVSYTGDKTFTFSGAANAPDGTHPTVTNKVAGAVNFGTSETITFTNGISSAGGLMSLYKVESASISATDGTVTTNSVSVTVNPAAAASLALSAASGNVTAGTSDQLTITAKDAYGNVATGYTGDKTFTFSGANNAPDGTHPTVTNKVAGAINFGTSETITFTNGVSSAGGLMILYKTETASITGTDGTFTSNAVSITVNPTVATSLLLSAAAGTMTAGTTDQLTITAKDAYGNVATGYTGDKTFTFSGAANAPDGTHPTVTNKVAGAVNFGTSETITFTNGISSAGGLMTLYKSENASLSATDGTLTSNTVPVTVNAASATSLLLAAVSGTIAAGDTDQLTITAKDPYGNVATSYTGDKTFTFSGANTAPFGTNPTVTNKTGTAINFGTSETLTFTNGVATAGGLMRLYKAEVASITGTDGTLTTNAVSVTVNSTGALNLTLSVTSGTVVAGNTDQLVVAVTDFYGNPSSVVNGDITLTFAGASSIGSYDPTVTDKTGTAQAFGNSTTITFTNGASSAGGLMTLYRVGTFSITAINGGSTSNAVSVTVSSAAASSLTLSAVSNATTAGDTNQLTLIAFDLYGNISTGYSGDKTFTFSGANNSPFGNHPTVTNKTGTSINFGTSETLTFTNGVLSAGGLMTLYKAETAGVSGSDGTLTSNSVTVNVQPATVSTIALGATSGTVTAGESDQLSISVTVTAQDIYGNIANNYSGDKTFIFTGASSIGSYHPTATDKNSVPINFGTPTTLTFNNGVLIAGGLLTLYKVEAAAVTGNDGSFTSNPINITVIPAAAASFSLSAASSSIVAGTTDQLTITAYDLYGNTATSYSGDKMITFSGALAIGSYVPSATDKNSNAINFGSPATLTFTNGVSSAGGLLTLYRSGTVPISLTDGALTSSAVSITVTPAAPATLNLDASKSIQTVGINNPLVITALDLYGNVATSYNGNKTLTFSGANPMNTNYPSVTDKNGVPVNFGAGTTLTFTNGVSTAGGSMVLYRAETASLVVTDGTLTSNVLRITATLVSKESTYFFAPFPEPYYPTSLFKNPKNTEQKNPFNVDDVIKEFKLLSEEHKYEEAIALTKDAFSRSKGKEHAKLMLACAEDVIEMLYKKGKIREAIIWRKQSLVNIKAHFLNKRIVDLWRMQALYRKYVGEGQYQQDQEISNEIKIDYNFLNQRLNALGGFKGLRRQLAEHEVKAEFYYQNLRFNEARKEYKNALRTLWEMRQAKDFDGIEDHKQVIRQGLMELASIEGKYREAIHEAYLLNELDGDNTSATQNIYALTLAQQRGIDPIDLDFPVSFERGTIAIKNFADEFIPRVTGPSIIQGAHLPLLNPEEFTQNLKWSMANANRKGLMF
jgi:tetratricopeptide (TPR) repeat protein